jgi:hypothetical protein
VVVHKLESESQMKITGYGLREAIKLHKLRSDEAASSFDSTLKAFEDEEKESPQSVVERYLAAEAAVSRLQTAQAEYNIIVKVTVDGATITLSEAIKRAGGLGRAEKMWRSAASPKKDRYSTFEDTRDPTREHAKCTITATEAAALASKVAKTAGRFRAVIATANTVEVDIIDLDPVLFE